MTELKVTRERVLKAVEEHPEARGVLETLFPSAMEEDSDSVLISVGDVAVVLNSPGSTFGSAYLLTQTRGTSVDANTASRILKFVYIGRASVNPYTHEAEVVLTDAGVKTNESLRAGRNTVPFGKATPKYRIPQSQMRRVLGSRIDKVFRLHIYDMRLIIRRKEE